MLDHRLRRSTSPAGPRSPVVRSYGSIPLLKPIKGAILPSKAPGIWRMSVDQHDSPAILRATGTVPFSACQSGPTPKEEFMKILVVLTSHDKLGNTGRKTGFWLEEFAAPYYTFKEAGAEIVLASPKGGQPPLDPKSNEPSFQTELTHRFERKSAARDNTGSLGCWRQPERADRL